MSTPYFVQSNTMYLSGSGVIVGATSLSLTSFTDIYGNVLTMADFGTVGYGTLEPDTTNEEAFSFTGVTANANGTYTLTGIKTALAKSPYTETSGLVRAHSGGTKVVISDPAAFWGNLKAYIDAAVVAGGVPATEAVQGISKLSVAPTVVGTPIVVGDNDPRVTPNNYGVDVGATDDYVITLTKAPASYVAGQVYTFKANTSNTGVATLNVNALGAKSILTASGGALTDSIIAAGDIVTVTYDGTAFRIPKNTSPTLNYQTFTANGTWTKPSGLTGNEIVVIQCWGGGGGGGGNSVAANRGGGGGGGGFTQTERKISELGATETVTIAAGGTGGANGTGNSGGTTTFGTHSTAYGGGGGGGGDGGGSSAGSGGGGGGSTSAGTSGSFSSSTPQGGNGGNPGPGLNGNTLGGALLNNLSGAGGGTTGTTAGYGYSGGGGGGYAAGVGGNSVMGGGGGGSGNGGAGGTSIQGGAGGAGATAGAGNAGVAPAGGGGGGYSAGGTNAGGAGARGECRVWVINS